MSNQFIPASLFSLMIFAFVILSVLGMIIYQSFRIDRQFGRKISILLLIWTAMMSTIVLSGLLQKHIFPAGPLFLMTINVGALVFGLSPWGKKLSTSALWMLVIFQGFRLPLELVLHMWAEQGTVPTQMTWTGQNFDIVAGSLALLALFKPFRNRNFYWIFNCIGIFLLLNVLRVVMMSSPFPFSWPLVNPLQLIFYMPYALIGIVCVCAAVTGHIILTRALLQEESARKILV